MDFIEMLKELKATVAKLEASNVDLKKELADKVVDLEKAIDEASKSRKTTFGETEVYTERVVDKAVKDMKNIYFKSAILGKAVADFDGYKEAAAIVEKALVPTDVTNWLDEAFSKDVVAALELELKVASIFDKVVVPNGVESLSIPSRTGNLQSYLIAAGADAVESAITAGKINMKPVKFKTLTVIADEANEEAVTAVLDLSKAELTRSLARAVESAIILGDTAIAAANDTNKAYDGLLKLGRAIAVDAAGVALTEAMILAARAKLGVTGVMQDDLVLVVNATTYIKMLGIGTVLTHDKFGPEATITKGSLGKIYGIDIMLSEYIPNDLETVGTNLGTGATTAVLLVNKTLFLRSERQKGILSESDRNIVSDTTLLTASYSNYFVDMAVGQESVVAIVNVLP